MVSIILLQMRKIKVKHYLINYQASCVATPNHRLVHTKSHGISGPLNRYSESILKLSHIHPTLNFSATSEEIEMLSNGSLPCVRSI